MKKPTLLQRPKKTDQPPYKKVRGTMKDSSKQAKRTFNAATNGRALRDA